jgi:hypothetical protein
VRLRDALLFSTWRLILSPFHAWRMVAIHHRQREAVFADAAYAEAQVWLHRQQLRRLQELEQQAAEADVSLSAATEALLELTKTRMTALRSPANGRLATRGSGSRAL